MLSWCDESHAVKPRQAHDAQSPLRKCFAKMEFSARFLKAKAPRTIVAKIDAVMPVRLKVNAHQEELNKPILPCQTSNMETAKRPSEKIPKRKIQFFLKNDVCFGLRLSFCFSLTTTFGGSTTRFGTISTWPHFGHFPRLPAMASSTRAEKPQAGHLKGIAIPRFYTKCFHLTNFPRYNEPTGPQRPPSKAIRVAVIPQSGSFAGSNPVFGFRSDPTTSPSLRSPCLPVTAERL